MLLSFTLTLYCRHLCCVVLVLRFLGKLIVKEIAMSCDDHKQPIVKKQFSLVESSGKVDLWECVEHLVFLQIYFMLYIDCYIYLGG